MLHKFAWHYKWGIDDIDQLTDADLQYLSLKIDEEIAQWQKSR